MGGGAVSGAPGVRDVPELPDGSLVPDYAGVRPKIQGPGDAAKDFVLLGPRVHGVRGLIHFFGIESPGLTASLALARYCVEALDMSRLPEE